MVCFGGLGLRDTVNTRGQSQYLGPILDGLSHWHMTMILVQRPQSKEYIFKSTSRVLLCRDTIDRVLFYIEMTIMMS